MHNSDSYAKHSNLTVLFGNDTGHNVIYSVGGCVEIEIPKLEMENHLREKRQAHALSQKQLADLAGITRQAISALESNQYSPATSVALQLARALQCRVEDLFSIKRGGEIIEGELLGALPQSDGPVRAQVTQIGHRVLVRPLIGIGELSSLSANADGLIIGTSPDKNRVKVRLLKDREAVRRKIVVGGCDPAMFLAGEHVRKHDQENLVPCLMGSSVALNALKRGEIHVAGIHLAEEKSEGWELPNLKHSLGDMDCIVVTFAHWEEGFIVRQGNPKKVRTISDIAKTSVRIVNREKGSGARRLLDKQLNTSGIKPTRVKGYGDEVLSHSRRRLTDPGRLGRHRHRRSLRRVDLRLGLRAFTARTLRLGYSEKLLRNLERSARPAGHDCQQTLQGRTGCAGRIRYSGNRQNCRGQPWMTKL